LPARNLYLAAPASSRVRALAGHPPRSPAARRPDQQCRDRQRVGGRQRRGHELRFAVNYPSGFLLTRLPLPLMVASAPSCIQRRLRRPASTSTT
jgi:hypothetical protein